MLLHQKTTSKAVMAYIQGDVVMSTVISVFMGDGWRGMAVEGDFFSQASLLVERLVKSGKASHGHCYTIDRPSFRIVEWFELGD